MGVTVRPKGKSWVVTIHEQGQKETKTLKSRRDAEDLAKFIRRQELAGVNVIETARRAKAVAPAIEVTHPTLRQALPEWLDTQVAAGEIRAVTATIYKCRLRAHVFPFALPDGRLLGDLPVDQVTREHLGATIRRARERGRSRSISEGIRNPVVRYYADAIERKLLPGPNPAADLKYFIGKGHGARRSAPKYFAQEQAPQLLATAKALHPRWSTFILTGLLGGQRWGETAALRKTDIDFQRAYIHLERTVSDRGTRIEPCKNGKDRWVKLSPALAEALKVQIETVTLEGQVKGWTPEQRALVFPTSEGNVLRYPYFLSEIWQPLLAKAGLPYKTHRATRHSFATWLVSDGANLQWVQSQLGHASIKQTADTYAHCQPEKHEHAAAKLDQYISV
jgi:integrase